MFKHVFKNRVQIGNMGKKIGYTFCQWAKSSTELDHYYISTILKSQT